MCRCVCVVLVDIGCGQTVGKEQNQIASLKNGSISKQSLQEQIVQGQRYCKLASDHRASLAMPQQFAGNNIPCFAKDVKNTTLKCKGTIGTIIWDPSHLPRMECHHFLYLRSTSENLQKTHARSVCTPKKTENLYIILWIFRNHILMFHSLDLCSSNVHAIQWLSPTAHVASRGTRVPPALWSYPPLIVEIQQLQVAQIQPFEQRFFRRLYVSLFFISYMPKHEKTSSLYFKIEVVNFDTLASKIRAIAQLGKAERHLHKHNGIYIYIDRYMDIDIDIYIYIPLKHLTP